jgi:hypothetical protein
LIIYEEFNSPAHDYEDHTIVVVATDTTTRLEFAFENDNGVDALDDVSVTLVSDNPAPRAGFRVGDAELASVLGMAAAMPVGPAAVAPAAVSIEHLAPTLSQYFAAPATPPDLVASLRFAPVNPVYDQLTLLAGPDVWTL